MSPPEEPQPVARTTKQPELRQGENEKSVSEGGDTRGSGAVSMTEDINGLTAGWKTTIKVLWPAEWQTATRMIEIRPWALRQLRVNPLALFVSTSDQMYTT